MTKQDYLLVNSSHHQAVKRRAPGFRATGMSSDGIIEVMETTDSARRILAVQFHPEALVGKDVAMLNIFNYFIQEALSTK